MLVEVLKQCRKLRATNFLYFFLMSAKSRQSSLHYLLKFILFHKLIKQKVSTYFSCMVQKDCHHKVHALHVAYRCLVVGIGAENADQTVFYFLSLEILKVLKSSFNVELDVLLVFCGNIVAFEVKKATSTVVFVHLVTFELHLIQLVVVEVNPLLILE